MAKKKQKAKPGRRRSGGKADTPTLSTAERLELRSLITLAKLAKEKSDAGKPLTKREIAAVAELERRQRGEPTGDDGFYRTQADIANAHGVHVRTAAGWTKKKGFPARCRQGYPKKETDQFVTDGALGITPQAQSVGGVTLAEANIRKTIEDAELSRIRKERAEVEQARELGEIVLNEDVQRFYLQTVATVSANMKALHDVVDRAMPEGAPTDDTWPAVRKRVLDICRKLETDVAAAMKELE